MMRTMVALLLSLMMSVSVMAQVAGDPADAVVDIYIKDLQTGDFVTHATGFLIDQGGSVLTTAHVVDEAAKDPKNFGLRVIVGKEFYEATVVCAAKFTPRKLSRDVAKLQLAPVRTSGVIAIEVGKEHLTLATSHRGDIPSFPHLSVEGQVFTGQRVRIIGYGHISPIPRKWTSEGQVTDTFTASDGTPVFEVMSSNPAQPGHSGSPVLNDQNQVVGLLAWANTDPRMRSGISGAALKEPCK